MSVRSVLSPDKEKKFLLKFITSEVEQLCDVEDILRHIIINFLTKSFHKIDGLIKFRTYAEELCSSGEFMGSYVCTSGPIVVFDTFKAISGVSIVYLYFSCIDGRCSAFQKSICGYQKCGNPCLLEFA